MEVIKDYNAMFNRKNGQATMATQNEDDLPDQDLICWSDFAKLSALAKSAPLRAVPNGIEANFDYAYANRNRIMRGKMLIQGYGVNLA